MPNDENPPVESSVVLTTAGSPGPAVIGKRVQSLYTGALVVGLIFVIGNPATNVYTAWWASWGVPSLITLMIAIPLWRMTLKSPVRQLTFKRAEPIELGPISARVAGVLGGLAAGALMGFMAHEALQVIGAALPGTSRVVSAEVVSVRKGGRKDRCNKFGTFNLPGREPLEACIDHFWRTSVTDEKLDADNLVQMTLKGNAMGEWVSSVSKDVIR